MLQISCITHDQLVGCGIPTCPSPWEAGKCLIIFNLSYITMIPSLGLYADLCDLQEQQKERVNFGAGFWNIFSSFGKHYWRCRPSRVHCSLGNNITSPQFSCRSKDHLAQKCMKKIVHNIHEWLNELNTGGRGEDKQKKTPRGVGSPIF